MAVAPELPRDLPQLLSSVERLMTRQLAAALEAEDCSVEEWRVLSLLSDGRGHTMSDVAEYALMPAPSLTKLVDRLVSGALVYRRKDPGDGRRVLVYLSARGRNRHRALSVPVERAETRMWEGLTGARDLADELARLKAQLVRGPGSVPLRVPESGSDSDSDSGSVRARR
ncbi:MarR family winged helix-turn-helix transcriptional regulator [Streptomyces sp. NPDC096142]|uniref:MarR family winged helix-turn-helix transcriptional regulator n=1 Tax=Streptomyces sp. NPDC096142 TaxID=3366077 RepID=UPI0037FECAA4